MQGYSSVEPSRTMRIAGSSSEDDMSGRGGSVGERGSESERGLVGRSMLGMSPISEARRARRPSRVRARWREEEGAEGEGEPAENCKEKSQFCTIT